MRKLLRSIVLWTFSGTLFFLFEVIWKLAHGNPEAISWTMLVLAAIICIPLDLANEHIPWCMPIWQQAILGGLGITAAELVAGLVLNVWLGLGVWDYSHLPLNLWGQISLVWSMVWVVVAGFGIVFLDWLRYWLYNEIRPHYCIRRRRGRSVHT